MTTLPGRNAALVQRLALAYLEREDANKAANAANQRYEVAKQEAFRANALMQGEARTCQINNSDVLVTVQRNPGGIFTFVVSAPNEAS